jgi:hypothetical protein
MKITLKKEHESTIIGYNNSGIPLGKRNDLSKLLTIAYESGHSKLFDLFEEYPSLEELKESNGKAFLAKIKVEKKQKEEVATK